MAIENSYQKFQPGMNPGIMPGMIPTNGAPPMAPGYGVSIPGYTAQLPGYAGPPPGYAAQTQGYTALPPGYGASAPGYGAPQPQMGTLMQGLNLHSGLESLQQVWKSNIFSGLSCRVFNRELAPRF